MIGTLTWGDVALRLGLALVASVLIGLDRGEHAHPAGLRTTVLITMAAALAMVQANWLLVHTVDTHNSILRADIMRLPLGILSGVGFIGAGAILRRGEMVRGLTSAATIWLVTVIGLCFGGGQLGLGAAGTVVAIGTLWGMKYLEAAVVTGRRGTVAVTLAAGGPDERALHAVLSAHGFVMRSRRVVPAQDGGTRVTCHGRYRGDYPAWSDALRRDLSARAGMADVEWADSD